jgi:hypothetical protein
MILKQILSMGEGDDETLYGLDDHGDIWFYQGKCYEVGDVFRGRKVIERFYTRPFWQPFDMCTVNPESFPSWNPSWIESRLEIESQ